jgi:hypothetical protein
MNPSQLIKTGRPVIPSYDYFDAGGLRHNSMMQRYLSAGLANRIAQTGLVHDNLLKIQLPRESKPGELIITHV